MKQHEPTRQQLIEENELLRERLWEAEQAISAIRDGEVDALVVNDKGQEHIYTLTGADTGYRVLVESMTEGALVFSLDAFTYYCNGALGEMLGLSTHEIIGSKLQALFPPKSYSVLEGLIRDCIRYGTARSELQMKRHDESLLPVIASLNKMCC